MAIYLKKFSTHQEYEAFTATTAFIKPNVSICTTEGDVHYNPLACEESSTYELVGTPSYPSEVDGVSTSFNMTFNYKRTDINEKCSETVTEGSDTVTVEIGANPSTASSRTVEGTYDYHGLEIPYSVTQTKFEAKVTAKFNVTDTSNPTKIAGYKNYFSAIEIDGVVQPSVVSAYTFNTTGEHTVKYTLTDPTSIGMDAFYNCSGLTSIHIPDGVTSIGMNAFKDCSGLTSCTIGSDVTSIGASAFTNCTNLTDVIIGSGVTSIDRSVFAYCSSLTSIIIPDSVTSIGDSAFDYCSGLTSCTIGSGVTSIGNGAFAICTELTSIDIPDSVTSIGGGAFQSCNSLTSITIPDNVVSIGDSPFYRCTSLTSVTIGNGVTNIGTGMCSGCTSLTTCTIGSGVTSIGEQAFSYCNSLTSITIPDSVTTIGVSAFRYCSGMTNITIGNGVTSIGNGAFYGCSGLTSITCNATAAPTIQSSTFVSVASNGILIAPQGSSGYDVWMGTGDYYLGKYNWTKVEQ